MSISIALELMINRSGVVGDVNGSWTMISPGIPERASSKSDIIDVYLALNGEISVDFPPV